MRIRKILKLSNTTLFAVLVFGLCVTRAGAQASEVVPELIPQPESMEMRTGSLLVNDGTPVVFAPGDDAAAFAAQHLAELTAQTPGIHLRLVRTASDQEATDIRLTRDNSIKGNEAYALAVTPKGVSIRASGDAGLYYGTVTLWQLLSSQAGHHGAVLLRDMEIRDEPQMRWRGIMVDSARHMQSIEFLHSLVDWMSLEKLNTLHWHLTDDQAWRLEIKRYPKLTSVGAWRPWPEAGAGAEAKVDSLYGGFYTQAQVRELVHYAQQRNVTIVPEIEMPGHATAAIAAYPELGSVKDVPSGPTNHFGIFPSIYSPSESTFSFLENVLAEVMDLFPGQYIHVGGDEALKEQWEKSPEIRARMAALGLHSDDEWQSYFIGKIGAYLSEHGRRMVGWDEILKGGLPANATVMSWHGVDGGIEAAHKHHDAVLTPVRPLYFDFRQTRAPDEHAGWGTENALASVYRFDPLPPTLSPSERNHILGVQANVWSEYLITDDRVAWMIFPRAAALAEIGWSLAERRDWSGFCIRLAAELSRYEALGVPFDPEAYSVQSAETVLPAAPDQVRLSLSNQVVTGSIRYTTDGSPVTTASKLFDGPVDFSLPLRLRAAVFVGNSQVAGSEINRSVTANSLRHVVTQQMTPCSPDPVIGMEHDPVYPGRPVMMVNYRDPCWVEKSTLLDGVATLTLQVQAMPWLFEDGPHKEPVLAPTADAFGEIEAHLDRCDGKLLASIPLPGGKSVPQAATLRTSFAPVSGVHDVCFQIRRPKLDPLWSLDWLQWNLGQEAKEDAAR